MTKQPSCEDLRLGQTISGFRIHSPLGQGPYFRIYGADRGEEEWRLYAWDKLPAPDATAVEAFGAQAKTLLSLKNSSLIGVEGPFTFQDGAIGWAVAQPAAKDARSLIEEGKSKASAVSAGLSACAAALSRALEAGVAHPNLSPESLFISQSAPFGYVGGFFSWRRFYPRLSEWIGQETENPYTPTGKSPEGSMIVALQTIGRELGVEASGDSLSALSQAFLAKRPGFWGRLIGK